METHGIIIIDASNGRITVMHSTHNQDAMSQDNIQLAIARYEAQFSGSCNPQWMEFAEPLTIHNL